MFILQTETKYKFEPSIDSEGKLCFEYDNNVITIDNLTDFICDQVNKQEKRINELIDEIKSKKAELEKLKIENQIQ